jgi:hypothetical protein
MAQQSQVNLPLLNMQARQAILAQSIEMTQSIFSTTIASPGSTSNVINVIPRNVGLIKKFLIEITATIANTTGGAVAITPTEFGASNILSQIVFNDLNNNVRINTTGWHAAFIASIKAGRPFGAAYTNDITPAIDYDAGFTSAAAAANNIISATASIADAMSGTVNMIYEVPLAYNDFDLRGSVYANVVNATMNLQLTINPTPVAADAASLAGAIYHAAGGAGNISSITINVYQVYLDQLPVGKAGPLLPILDLSTIYELKNTTLTGLVVNQDFPVAYANFRQFLSTFAVLSNGVGTGGLAKAGIDVNTWALQSANFTNIFKIDPKIAALMTRNRLGTDLPNGAWYFDHRIKPLSTIQYGNMQLVLNPKTVNANAALLMGFEDFALVNTISGAGSLPAS